MKELKFIQCCPSDIYYTWQVNLWLESLREIGQSDKAINLIFTPKGRENRDKWKQIENLYPEAEFHYYADEDNLTSLIGIYIPVIRPYVLWKHFKKHPELSEKAIFYCDSDVLFTKEFNVEQFLEDDINYLSDTNSYINSDYINNKVNDCIPEKRDQLLQIDVLQSLTSYVGITKEIAEKNKKHSGGAQYLLKNIDADFWKKVMSDTIFIRQFLLTINKEYFKNESTGYQSWCADMWAVLYNIWYRNLETKVVKELDFAWATEPIEKLNSCTIYHNAGVTGKYMNDIPYFYKGAYHTGQNPLLDEHLETVINNEQSKKYCTWYYTNKLLELKNKYNINY